MSHTEVMPANYEEWPKPTQPWVSRGLKGLARVLYKETDETEIFITAGNLGLSYSSSSRPAAMSIKIPKIPIIKNVLTVALPRYGFGIALSRQERVQEAEGTPLDLDTRHRSEVGANLPAAALSTPVPCDVPPHGNSPPEDDRLHYNENGINIDKNLGHGHNHDENYDSDDNGDVQPTEELPILDTSHRGNGDSKIVIEEPSVLESTIRKFSSQKILFGVPRKPDHEDVDEYAVQLEASKHSPKSQTQDEDEAKQAWKNINDTTARLESRIDKLSSSKNDFKAQRDEANNRVKQLEAYLAALDPGRTRALMQKNIKDLREQLEISQKETEIECDAKSKLEDKVQRLKDEIVRVEDKEVRQTKNEKKLRASAKERLVEQHEGEIKELKARHQDELDVLGEQHDTEIVKWQQMVTGYQHLGKELYGRLQQVETSLLGNSYPTSWREAGKIFSKIASRRDKVLQDGFFKELHEKAHELFPQIVEHQEDDEPAEPVVVEERYDDADDEDHAGDTGVAQAEALIDVFVDEVLTDLGQTTEEDEKSSQTGSEAEAGYTSESTIDEEIRTFYSPLRPSSGGSHQETDANGFRPQLKPSFDFSTEMPAAFNFGSSSPREATDTGAPPPGFNFGSGIRFATSFGAHQRARSSQEGRSSASPPQDTAASAPFPSINPFQNTQFPIFGEDLVAPSQQDRASFTSPPPDRSGPEPPPFVNPFQNSHSPPFGADSWADTQREGEAFASSPCRAAAPVSIAFAHPFENAALPIFGANTGFRSWHEGGPSASPSAEQPPTRPSRQTFNPYAHVQSPENSAANTASQSEQDQDAPEPSSASAAQPWAQFGNESSGVAAGYGGLPNRSTTSSNESTTDSSFSAFTGAIPFTSGTGTEFHSTPGLKRRKPMDRRKKR